MLMFAILGELRDTTIGYSTSDAFGFVLQTGPARHMVFPGCYWVPLLGMSSGEAPMNWWRSRDFRSIVELRRVV
jgi:hypothetical protein